MSGGRYRARERVFLFLQGPHGPFFAGLGRALGKAGASVIRVGFNLGDRVFWPGSGYIPYDGTLTDWPNACAAMIAGRGVTDIVLYGDTRPLHAQALAVARKARCRLHIFEEGYLRPYWVSYERDGANARSRLLDISLSEMAAALPDSDPSLAAAPAVWGDMREHIGYGALYHGLVLLGRRPGALPPHRGISLAREARLNLLRPVLLPGHVLQRLAASRRVRRGGFPYHVVLLQLAHDASFRCHGPFAEQRMFVEEVLAAFARGAPRDHHLILKAHPLEDDREPLRPIIARAAEVAGIAQRVHFIRGGKLAGLLDGAQGAVTVNSTAAQQALWRGLPVRSFGRSVYDRPEFVSGQPLEQFFAAPRPPDLDAYRLYRRFLLATSQVEGGFYSAAGRRRLMAILPEMMLAEVDPYDRVLHMGAAPRQHPRATCKRSRALVATPRPVV